MTWSILFALTLGGVLVAFALRLAGAGERARRHGRTRTPGRSRPSWSGALRGVTTCICRHCGALNLLSASQVAPGGAPLRCASCHRTAHLPPPLPRREGDVVPRSAARLRSS